MGALAHAFSLARRRLLRNRLAAARPGQRRGEGGMDAEQVDPTGAEPPENSCDGAVRALSRRNATIRAPAPCAPAVEWTWQQRRRRQRRGGGRSAAVQQGRVSSAGRAGTSGRACPSRPAAAPRRTAAIPKSRPNPPHRPQNPRPIRKVRGRTACGV